MAKTQEPNQTVKTVDETSGLVSSPVRESVRIGCIIDADTGTTNRVRLASQKQLINTYLTGSTINQKHNQSIQCVAALLNYAAVDVIRVDSGKMRVGVGSAGNLYYCSETYKPLSQLDWIPIDDDIDLKYNVLWIHTSDGILYYLWDDMRTQDDTSFADSASVDASVAVNLAVMAPDMSEKYSGMIERFFYGLEVTGVTLYDSFTSSRFATNIDRWSGDNRDASGNPGFYNVSVIKTPASKLTKYESVGESVYAGDEVEVDGTIWTVDNLCPYTVYRNGDSNRGKLDNGKSTNYNMISSGQSIAKVPGKEFLARLADKIYTKEIPAVTPWGYDSEFSLTFNGVSKIVLHGAFYEELYVESNNVIRSKDANDVCGLTGFGEKYKKSVEPSFIEVNTTSGKHIVFCINKNNQGKDEDGTVWNWIHNPQNRSQYAKNATTDSQLYSGWGIDSNTIIIGLGKVVTGQGALFKIFDILRQVKAVGSITDTSLLDLSDLDVVEYKSTEDKLVLSSAALRALTTIDTTGPNWDSNKETSVVYKVNGAEPTITVINFAGAENPIKSGIPSDDYYEFKHELTSTNKNYATFPSLFFCVDQNCYYSGSKPALSGAYAYISLTKQNISVEEFLKRLYTQLKADYTFGKVSYSNNGKTFIGFRLSGNHEYDWSGNPDKERNQRVIDENIQYYSYDGEHFFADNNCSDPVVVCGYANKTKASSAESVDVYINGKKRNIYAYTLQKAIVYNLTDNIQLNCSNEFIEHVDQDQYEDKYVVVGRFLTSGDQFKVSTSNNNDDFNTKNLILTYKETEESTYKISFDPDAVNDYGQSLYYDKINDGISASDYFYIYERNIDEENTPNGGVIPEGFTRSFGKELDVMEPDTADYIEAIQKFTSEKYNTDDTKYDFIWDSGIADPSFARACSAVADKLNAEYPCSFPTKDKNMKDAFYINWQDYADYRDAVGVDTPRTIFHAPVFKVAAVSTYMNTLPRSFSYIVSRISAYNSIANEFMALFGPTNGQIQAGTQPVKFDLDEREGLLDRQINSVITNSNGTYFNNNLTGQKEGSYLSEDQNIYMTNVISHICEEYNPTLFGKQNSPELWSKVIQDLTTRINNRMISNKADKLNGFKIVCNSQLNPREMIEQNTLTYEVWVMYNLSVKYVRAYVCVKRLGSF